MAPPAVLALIASVVVVIGAVGIADPVEAAPCDEPIISAVACENTLPGNPESEWGISGAGSASIQGFPTDISVDQGGTVGFKIDTAASSYRLDIYRMGYYGGDGARFITSVSPTVINNQPSCLNDPATGLVDCGNWAQNASWTVPSDAVSGIYFAKLVRTDGPQGSSHIFFIVRDDDGGSQMLFQTSDTTWQAYNTYGGNSLYVGAPAGRAYKVSYNRPITTRDTSNEDFVFNAEYPMVRFLERNGYDVSYTTGIDTDRLGAELLEHQVFLSVGHDEYWSGDQRTNIEAARAAGVHLAFFSGNEMFWKTRWENSIDGSGTPYRTLVSYKETHASQVIDPEAPTWTGTWRDARFSPPGDGGRPENAVTGQIFKVNCCDTDMVVNAADGAMRFWRDTRVAALTGSQTTTVGSQIVGYEWDEDLDNGFRPPGAFRVSETAGSGDILQDEGNTYGFGPATHSMITYRHSSGALVFGAGTVQWSWGLDENHDRGFGQPADDAAQQATVNLFADMGVQPTTLMAGLTPATQSTDTTPAASTIVSPTPGQNFPLGGQVTVTGTASDTGGGRVGGVEVSVDGGATWRRATGRETWSYSFNPAIAGPTTILSRAVDDSANLGSPSAGVPITIDASGVPCPCSIWSSSQVPAGSDSDTDSVEVGVKFTVSEPGFVTGIRFHKSAQNTGTHVGTLWTATGTNLGSVTFTGETASGWQEATFASPIPVQAGTTYIASYFAPNGRYSVNSSYFASTGVTNGPLTAPESGPSGGNGVFNYSATPSTFPTDTYQAENYWVDVVFDRSGSDTTAPTVVGQVPVSGASGVSSGSVVSVTFSEAVVSSSVVMSLTPAGGSAVAASLSYDAGSRTMTLTPSAVLANDTVYTVDVSGATDPAGNTMIPTSWTFTTEAADTTAPTVVGQVPASGASGVGVGGSVSATFSEVVVSSSVVMSLTPAGGSAVAASLSYDAGLRTMTLTPSAVLANDTVYTVDVSGATDPAGNTMVPVSWSFTTGAPSGCPCTIWSEATVPPVPASGDTSSVELGVKFQTSQAGSVTGVRFYKGVGNSGTHVGNLWSASGTNLGSVTFVGETASGWQEASFASPIPVQADTTYVVSYHAPNGNYSEETGGLTALVSNGPLTALASGSSGGNGVYAYGSGGFPDSTWNDTNYFVDVVLDGGAADTTAPTVTTQVPASGASGVSTGSVVSATFSEAVVSSSVVMSLTPAGGSAVAATTSYDAGSRTMTLTPSASLANDTVYTVDVSGATDPAGNTMVPTSWSFTTEVGDVTAPTVVGQVPASGVSGVPVSAVASATFSEAVVSSSVVMSLTPAGGSAVAATTSYDAGLRTMTLTPSAALATDTVYTVDVSGATDPAGNTMTPTSWTFTTEVGDVTAPTVTTQVPASGVSGVPVSAVASATFSEAVVSSSVVMSLTPAGGSAVAATTSYDAGLRTMTLTPSAALANDTVYTVDVSGATDPAGNTMTPTSWTFTTEAASTNPELFFSTLGSTSVPTVTGSADDADIYNWNETDFSRVFDASAVGLPSGADIDAYDRVDDTSFYASFVSTNTSVPGIGSVQDEDIVFFDGTTWSLFFDGTAQGMTANGADIDAIDIVDDTVYFSTVGNVNPAGVSGSADDADIYSWNGTTFARVWDASANGLPGSADLDGLVLADPARFYGSFRATSTSIPGLGAIADVDVVYNDASTWSSHFDGVAQGLVAGTGHDLDGFDIVLAGTGDTTAPTVVGQVPASATTGVPVSAVASATFSEAVVSSSVVMSLTPAGGSAVAATTSYDAGLRTMTLTPSAVLATDTVYTVDVSGATDPAGNTMTPTSWTFTTEVGDVTAPTVTTQVPASGVSGVPVSAVASATFSEAVVSSSVVMSLTPAGGSAVAATTSYDAGLRTMTLTPSAALATDTVYTVDVSGATDPAGNTMTPTSWTFTTEVGDVTAPTVTTQVPASGASGVPVSAVASATFSEVVVSSSVVMSLTPAGGSAVAASLSYDAGLRTMTLTPSAVLANDTVYTVDVSGATDPAGNTMIPTSWTFTTEVGDITPPVIIGRVPVADASGVSVGSVVSATFSEVVVSSSVVMSLTPAGGSAVAASLSYDAGLRTMTLTPSAVLANDTVYTVDVSGATDPAGNTMVPVSWSFTTGAPSGCPCTIWSEATVPPVPASGDTSSVELGVKFQTSQAGSVTGVRFYKGVGNSGTHVGNLWSASGTNLGSVTFVGETASGWQEASFASPIPVQADTTYVVSYHAPNGNYSEETGGLTALVSNGPLTALASGSSGGNGVYAYGSGGFPDSTWNDTNYFVDVVLDGGAADTTAPTVTTQVPASGASGVSTGSVVSATFSEAVVSSSVVMSLTPAGGSAVAATTSYDAGSRTMTLTPSASLANDTVYTVDVSGATDPAGNTMVPTSWSFTTEAADTTAPTVVGQVPASATTGVPVSAVASATFSEAVVSSSVVMSLTPAGGSAVAATTSYDAGLRTMTLTPSAALATDTVYTVDVSGATDPAGNTMTPTSWTFTTTDSTSGCPCTIWSTSTVPTQPSSGDGNAVEVGLKFQAASDGFVTGVRFYKGAGNTGTHVGSLWTSSGTKLGSVTFTNETSSGWQEATLASPLFVNANTTYVVSYYAPAGNYALETDGMTNAVTNGPLTALASGASGGNGVYVYGASAFPTNTFSSSNYFVDVVYDTNSSDTTPPTVTALVPADGAINASVVAPIQASFNEQVVGSSVVMSVTGPGSTDVPGVLTYDAASLTASFDPNGNLEYSTVYQVDLSGAEDPAGNTMAPVAWSFTTADEPPPLPTDGPGGPIGVVTSATDAFSGYFAEILRSEGLNEFATFDVGDLDATALTAFDTVILGHVSLTATQVSELTTWVNGGGNLIASRPDPQLASLLGITAAGGTLAEGYVAVDTSTSPGAGIVGETMQYHGVADRYTLSGAASIATLYSNATTPTGYPAVTLRSVGGNGGQAAAFTFDLARSIVYTRQGNPAWEGQERDNILVIRSNDLFFGGSQTDWVNLDKVAIPQADEQQRLLANLIQVVNRDVKPLPRFWYFPDDHRAVVVATGDDHANGGTSGRFDTYLANSPAGCSTTDWECHRFTSYIWPGTPMSDTAAANYDSQDFEIAVHPENSCTDFASTNDLRNTYAADIAAFSQSFPSLPSPVSNRMHCLVWSDWSSQFIVESENGMRFDVNYYYYPGSWILDRPGFMTGSGMPQRFANTDGTMVDVYQAPTQMTDESGQSYPFTPNTLLDRALGAEGYYGYFVANMHTDSPTIQEDTALVSSATARGVPLISARDALEFIDGRSQSSFQNLAWTGSQLTFDIVVGSGANNLTSMVPTLGPGSQLLTGIQRGSSNVSYQVSTIKGIEYATFPAIAGSHTVTYAGGGGGQLIENATADVDVRQAATLEWSTVQPSASEVMYGTSPDDLGTTVAQDGAAGTHRLEVDGLTEGETYYYRIVSDDASGERSTWPAEDLPPAEFVVPTRDVRAPIVSALNVVPRADGTALVTWRTDEPAATRVRFGTAENALTSVAHGATDVTEHAVVITGLSADTTYFVSAESPDATLNRRISPQTRTQFVTPPAGVAEYMAPSQRVGDLSGAAVIVEDEIGQGRITLDIEAGDSGTFTSRALDARRMVEWDAIVVETASGMAGVTVSVRAGNSEVPDDSWSAWQEVAGAGTGVELASRFVQYRLELTADTGEAPPAVTAVSITHRQGMTPPLGEAHGPEHDRQPNVLVGTGGWGVQH